MLKKKYAWPIWLGVILACVLYVFLFFRVISPFALRWQALYGEIEFPEGYSIRGLDVSHHQGEIDWRDVVKAKVDGSEINFVFIKATEGKDFIDENFNDNFFEARENGLIRGAYHYFKPGIPAKEQAHFYLKQVHLEEGDLPPVLDYEEVGGLSTEQIQQNVRTWCKIVQKATGVKPIIYTNVNFKESYLNTKEFNEYPFWIAHYYVNQLKYEGKWKFWQHTDRRRIDGIDGFVDFNIYNGSMYDLRKNTISYGEEEEI